jgi:hypothetical protein
VNRGIGVVCRRTPALRLGVCIGHLLISVLRFILLSLSTNDSKSMQAS